jgi:hypothetical protein
MRLRPLRAVLLPPPGVLKPLQMLLMPSMRRRR